MRTPIKWWENGYVDMGSYADSVRSWEGGQAGEIIFSFRFSSSRHLKGQVDPFFGVGHSLNVRTALCALGHEDCRLAWCEVSDPSGNSCTLRFAVDGRITAIFGTMSGTIVDLHDGAVRQLLGDAMCDRESLFGFSTNRTPDGLLKLAHDLFHGNTDEYRRQEILLSMDWRAEENVLKVLREQNLGKKYKRNLNELMSRPEEIGRYRRARFAFWAVETLTEVGHWVQDFAQTTAYIGPFRAIPERSVRPDKGVAVEQLDVRGGNLADFLASLSEDERNDLNEFIFSSLNFRVFVSPDGSHWKIRIELENRLFNLIDVGFGYSQVLPVIVQLWASGRVLSNARDRRVKSTFVIEQPELHLHPHQQVLVARALAASASAEHGPMLMVETHSENMIGEIGRMVSRDELSPERVQILCVEAHPDGGAKIEQATFDEDGYLNNWPAGFLSP